MPELERAVEVIKKLLHPTEGCPWDLEQTHKSLLPYLIEESYEFMEAVENDNSAMMEEEIGDILLQVLLHSALAEKHGRFTIESMARAIADKMVRRHPHVFGEGGSAMTSAEVVSRWNEIKKEEKKSGKKYSIPKKLLYGPALDVAHNIGLKSTSVNFDWEDHLQVMNKVEEEWQEVKEELPPTGKFNPDRVKEEIGDLLFSVAQLARHCGLNAEECLQAANRKFIDRFQKMEDLVNAEGKSMQDTPQPELEVYWTRIKKS